MSCRRLPMPTFQPRTVGMMLKFIQWPITVFLATAPLGALGQSSDAAYCAALTDKYQQYIGISLGHRGNSDVAADVAIDKCKSGNTPAGIPVLEGNLRDPPLHLPNPTQAPTPRPLPPPRP